MPDFISKIKTLVPVSKIQLWEANCYLQSKKQQPDCFFFTYCAQCVLALHCSSLEISNCQEKQAMPHRQNRRVKKNTKRKPGIHLHLTKAHYIWHQCGGIYFSSVSHHSQFVLFMLLFSHFSSYSTKFDLMGSETKRVAHHSHQCILVCFKIDVHIRKWKGILIIQQSSIYIWYIVCMCVLHFFRIFFFFALNFHELPFLHYTILLLLNLQQNLCYQNITTLEVWIM